MTYKRTDRIADLLLREISRIISHRMNNPKVGFTTLTSVRVSRDIKYADVFVSVLGDQKIINETLKALDQSKSFIRNELAHTVHLKRVPEIRFQIDKTLEKANRIYQLQFAI